MNIPIFAYNRYGKRVYLFEILTSDGLEGMASCIKDMIEKENYHYSAYFGIYKGFEILLYEKSE